MLTDAGLPEVSGEPAAPANPLLLVHRALRGRYLMVIVLAALVGAAGAAAGFMATKPLYASQGWIRAFPRQPRVLYETEENQMMPMFEAFVRSQADLLRSRRVIDLALADPTMRPAGWEAPPDGARDLIEALEVTAQRGSELISVTVSHASPQAAQVAANAVLTAFMTYQEEQDGLSATERERRLRENQQLLSSELKAIRESILRVSDRFGGSDPKTLLESKTEQMTRLEMMMMELGAPAPAAAPGEGASPAVVQPQDVPPDELAKADQALAALLAEQRAINLQLEDKGKRLGARHFEMRALRDRLDGVEKQIGTRLAELRSGLSAAGPIAGATGPLAGEKAADYQHYAAIRERLPDEIRELNRAAMEVASLREREAEAEKRLAETSRALEVIRVENEIIRGGRVRIQQRAATPLQPTKDRRLPLAAAGLLGGAGLVVAGFVAASLVVRRVRYADDLFEMGRQSPLLGVIPEVIPDDPENAEDVSLSLHQVRNNLLQHRSPGQIASVFVVTSAMQGEGKTTLAIALAASFAKAGYETTLVDGDLVGRGLTRELGLVRARGLDDTLGREISQDHLHVSEIPNLTVLPTGSGADGQADQLALKSIRPVVEDLRQRGEIVIIDTGPVLGSLEAGILAQLADALVIVAARGTGGRMIQAAVERGQQLCRSTVGLVFNRARANDLSTSASYSSVRSARSTRDPGATPPPTASDRSRLVRLIREEPRGSVGNGLKK
ncbi:MAG: AAA family ATPase [Planctomycetota bacterium]|nr:AAA family ATPase [Planctomycetota bacterium]